MDLFEAINTRRSVRKFSSKPVDEDKLGAVLEAVRMAPSWANFQCWRLIMVKDSDIKNKLSELSFVESFFTLKGYKANPSKKALAEAPIVIVLCADTARSGTLNGKDYYLVDSGIAAQNLMLAARAQGLGTVFVGIYDEEKIKALLNVPSGVSIVGLIPLGYPLDEKKEGPARKAVSEFCFENRWVERAG